MKKTSSNIRAHYTRPWLAKYQLYALFHDKRYGLVEATTKAGKTVGCIVWLFEQALRGERGDNFWWVAPIYQQAKIAFRRMKDGTSNNLIVGNESELYLELANGARIWFKGGDNPDSLYGENVKAAVIDEASRVKEEAWHAVRSTLTHTRGPIRIIGNVKGRRNWAYRLARIAEAGERDMHYAKITAADAVAAGILNAEEVEDARKLLPDSVFRELYMAEPADDDGNPFGISAIRACIRDISTAPPVAWGWDLAKSVDYTVGIALDIDGYVCAFDRFQASWRDTIRRIKEQTHTYAMVDSTGVGDPVIEALQDGSEHFIGVKFSSQTKQQLMEGLALAIQRGAVRFPDGDIVRELESYEYEYTRTGVRYTAPEGVHDDCVCALALAVRCAAEYSHPLGKMPAYGNRVWETNKDRRMVSFEPPRIVGDRIVSPGIIIRPERMPSLLKQERKVSYGD